MASHLWPAASAVKSLVVDSVAALAHTIAAAKPAASQPASDITITVTERLGAVIFDTISDSLSQSLAPSVLLLNLSDRDYEFPQSVNSVDLTMRGLPACPLPSLAVCCLAARHWLDESAGHSVLVHSSAAASGRLVLALAAVIVNIEPNASVDDILATVQSKFSAVTAALPPLIPSQIRYAHHYLPQWVAGESVLNTMPRSIDRVIVNVGSEIQFPGRIYLQLWAAGKLVATELPRESLVNGTIVFAMKSAPVIIGDVLMRMRQLVGNKRRSVIRAQLHSAMMTDAVRLDSDELDRTESDSECGIEFIDIFSHIVSEYDDDWQRRQQREMERSLQVLSDRRPLAPVTANSDSDVSSQASEVVTSSQAAVRSFLTRFSLFDNDSDDENPPEHENGASGYSDPGVDSSVAAIIARSRAAERATVDYCASDDEDISRIDSDSLSMEAELNDDELSALEALLNEADDLPG